MTIELYRSAQAAALAKLSNRVAQVYTPAVFVNTGYPVTVETPDELVKFADVMQETRFIHTVDYMLFGGVSDDELALLREAAGIAVAALKAVGAAPIIPWNTLARSLLNYRHLAFAIPAGARVFELGPGSGYLGLLLTLTGFKHASVDVTEGFYLWQRALYRQGGGERFIDLAEPGAPALSNELWDAYDSIHLPWWKYHSNTPERDALRFDVVTCNHMLAEMSPASLHYLFEYCKSSRMDNKEGPVFIFESFGYDLVNIPQWYVNSRFYQYGYGLCHHDSLATVYAPADAAAGRHAARYPVVDLGNRLDVPQIRELGRQSLPDMWTARGYRAADNPLSSQIVERRERLKTTIRHDRAALVAALSPLAPDAPPPGLAADERALRVFGLQGV